MTSRRLATRYLAFTNWLTGLAKARERGTLAALASGLTLDEEHLYELYGSIPSSYLNGLAEGEQRLYLVAAALSAYYFRGQASPVVFSEESLAVRRRDLGESLRMLGLKKQDPDDDSGEMPEPLKRRMEAILAAPRDEVFGHLRQIVGLLKAEEIPIDWAQLMSDLHAWDWEGHRVQWRWSQSFYVGHQDEENDQSEEEDENHVR